MCTLKTVINNTRSFVLVLLLINAGTAFSQKIDRKALVDRNRVIVNSPDTLSSLTVGNGKFAFTVDATGLQTFPEYYAKGVPLGTQSEWGWHSFPNKAGYRFSEALKGYDFNEGNNRLYAVPNDKGRPQAVDYFRQNPHRLQMGNVGLEINKKDGSFVTPEDVKDVHQELNLWTGEITSSFSIEGIPVKVITCAHAVKDVIAVQVTSALIQQKRLKIRFRFPYPTDAFSDMGTNYNQSSAHHTTLTQPSSGTALLKRTLDNDIYYVTAKWNNRATIKKAGEHYYTLLPEGSNPFEVAVTFASLNPGANGPAFSEVRQSSVAGWQKFWQSGAAVDFSGSTDPRAAELERRVVLSQYLTRVQCAGSFPPQETGLTYNSWFGKPHMEMFWWHAAHYALWDRTE
jgi:hypothetical protein